jgi:hypothetical protein
MYSTLHLHATMPASLRGTWRCTRRKARNEWLEGFMIAYRSQQSTKLILPAKKLLFPEPLRPTTTLCFGEKGSIWVWSRSSFYWDYYFSNFARGWHTGLIASRGLHTGLENTYKPIIQETSVLEWRKMVGRRRTRIRRSEIWDPSSGAHTLYRINHKIRH